jgi:hypothetical protein
MTDAEVDHALAAWRQGDYVLGDHWFVHRTVADVDGVALRETPVPGLVVLTQTCDVIRASKDRPELEVSPLVEVSAEHLREIKKGYRPRYAYVPAGAPSKLVADLDRVMTVDKQVAATWERRQGHSNDAEARAFALAIGRKRTRFAFPDDFVQHARKLQARITDKHGRESPEGRALTALREIRVLATPSWGDGAVSLMYWFIRNEGDDDFEGAAWSSWLTKWLALVPAIGRYTVVEGQVTSLSRLTADEYVHSDPLDLDHLSGPVPTAIL